MLDPLLKLVEQSAQQHIIQNKAIPDQFNNASIKEVTNQILNNLKGQVTQFSCKTADFITWPRSGRMPEMNMN